MEDIETETFGGCSRASFEQAKDFQLLSLMQCEIASAVTRGMKLLIHIPALAPFSVLLFYLTPSSPASF
jgi:hypothetical protein